MRYAVVFKTYGWDPFIERQARRLAQVTGDGDFFVSIDETNMSFPDIPFENVVRTSNAKLIQFGLSDRFEKGSLIWWNADYPHYTFFSDFPTYDYYLFVEYDAIIHCSLQDMMARIARSETDFVALPVRQPLWEWVWGKPHHATYAPHQLRGTLNCIAILSNRAMVYLMRRRLEMAADPTVQYWPSSEAFLPSEITSVGYRQQTLAEFGDIEGYDWYPPTLEDDLSQLGHRTFLHPVLDEARYIALTLRAGRSVLELLTPGSASRQSLARLPPSSYLHLLPMAIRQRALAIFVTRIEAVRALVYRRLPLRRSSKP